MQDSGNRPRPHVFGAFFHNRSQRAARWRRLARGKGALTGGRNGGEHVEFSNGGGGLKGPGQPWAKRCLHHKTGNGSRSLSRQLGWPLEPSSRKATGICRLNRCRSGLAHWSESLWERTTRVRVKLVRTVARPHRQSCSPRSVSRGFCFDGPGPFRFRVAEKRDYNRRDCAGFCAMATLAILTSFAYFVRSMYQRPR